MTTNHEKKNHFLFNTDRSHTQRGREHFFQIVWYKYILNSTQTLTHFNIIMNIYTIYVYDWLLYNYYLLVILILFAALRLIFLYSKAYRDKIHIHSPRSRFFTQIFVSMYIFTHTHTYNYTYTTKPRKQTPSNLYRETSSEPNRPPKPRFFGHSNHNPRHEKYHSHARVTH